MKLIYSSFCFAWVLVSSVILAVWGGLCRVYGKHFALIGADYY